MAHQSEVFVLPRFHVGNALALAPGMVCVLPEGASRHVQVLRMQPGGQICLFDGHGHEWEAQVTEMGRKAVTVIIGEPVMHSRELPVQVTLAMGMPANDRMDALIEKAAELGAHAIQPLLCERSVLRLDGERAAKKVAHWQAVAVSACEQCGRSVVPQVHGIQTLQAWLAQQSLSATDAPVKRAVLSLRDAVQMGPWLQDATLQDAEQHLRYLFLSGPEGGLSPAEEQVALDAGWSAITLGPRVLRADTAPLAALSVIGAAYER